MDQKILDLKDEYISCRKNLDELIHAKKQLRSKKAPGLDKKIENARFALKGIKSELFLLCQPLIQEINLVRERIVSLLKEYRILSEKMTKSENLFLSHVVLSGKHLQMTIEKRKFLEREYHRILENRNWGVYSSPEELEQDVKETLHRAEVEFFHGDENPDEELIEQSYMYGWDAEESDSYGDEAKKKEIVREFRKIVMPKVHADTSETPFEVFNFVLGAYKRKDYLLMEAFVIEYRGELSDCPEDCDMPEFIDSLKSWSFDYPTVFGGLEERLQKTKKQMSVKELENFEAVQEQLIRQNKEINKAIIKEAEQILEVMKKLDELCEEEIPINKDKKS